MGKGQSGNPRGRPKNSNEQNLLKSLSRSDFMVLVNRILSAKPEELKEFKGTVLELSIVSALSKGIRKGDCDALFKCLDRLIGRPKEVVETHNFDETKERDLKVSEEILFKILLDEKSEPLEKVKVSYLDLIVPKQQ